MTEQRPSGSQHYRGSLNTLSAAIAELGHEAGKLRIGSEQEAQGEPGAQEEQGEEQSRQDPLTGIASRSAYERRLRQELAHRKRCGSSLVAQLWYVDDFDVINEEYEQEASDQILQLIAKIMKMHLRKADYIAQYDDGRFAVLLPATDLKAARWVADRLCRAAGRSEFRHEGAQMRVTVTGGYVVVREGDTLETLLERTEATLNQVKATGRNRYYVG